MPGETKIEWATDTWNPVTGCTKVSPGCKNCYAETFAERWRGTPGHAYEQGFDLRLWPTRLDWPVNKKKPMRIFVNSMSDLFHKDIPFDFIESVFKTMNKSTQHIFMVLTKRPELMAEHSNSFYHVDGPPILSWSSNIWAGTSVENGNYLHRIDSLRKVPAAIRFLSIEPFLGPIQDMDLTGIDWVIVGGESGRGARPMEQAWVERVRDICKEQNVAFFFKQWGGVNKKLTGRLLDGRTYDEYPARAVYPPGTEPDA